MKVTLGASESSGVAYAALTWLDNYLRSQGIDYDYKTDSLRCAGEPLDPRVAMASLRLAAHSQDNVNVRRLLNDLLTVWKNGQQRLVIADIRKSISHEPTTSDLVTEWVKAVMGRESSVDVAVARHFIWQIKRKLRQLPVEHHMMPILYGKSGGGKSVAVAKLLEPLSTVALTTNMSVFEDRFGKRQFTRNYVMFFDELAGAWSSEVNHLKQVITSPVMEWRVMHSEGVASAPQNCTFVGCTNDPVSERIKDATSARRFWQINCADRLDWDSINSIDYLALWRSVDEQQPCPVLPHIDEIRKVQDREVRFKDGIELWLEDKCEPHPFYGESPTTTILYDYFKLWCDWQAATYPGFQFFARALPQRIKMLGWDVESKHSNNGTVWSLKTK